MSVSLVITKSQPKTTSYHFTQGTKGSYCLKRKTDQTSKAENVESMEHLSIVAGTKGDKVAVDNDPAGPQLHECHPEPETPLLM